MNGRQRQRGLDQRPRLRPARLTPLALPVPRVLRLANGLQVLLIERHDLPLVRASLVLRSGTAQDPQGTPGAIFAAAAMLDEGAGSRSALEIATELQALGTALHTVVDVDNTSLALQVLRPRLEPALALLADVVCRPHFAQREFERVRLELINRAVERRSDAMQVGYLALGAAIFGHHPYGRPSLPLEDHLRRVALAQVRRCYREHFVPANALLVVAGAIGHVELTKMLERLFGRWQGGAPRRAGRPRPPLAGPRLVLIDRPGSTESAILVGEAWPGFRLLPHPDVMLLNTILGGSFTSRLNRNLRERRGYTYGIGSAVFGGRLRSLLAISTQVEPGVTSAAIREILHELRALGQEAVGKHELGKAARLVAEELPDQAETLAGLSGAYAELVLHGRPPGSLNQLPLAAARVSPRALLALSRRLLHPERATIVVVGETERFAAELQRAFGPALWRPLASC